MEAEKNKEKPHIAPGSIYLKLIGNILLEVVLFMLLIKNGIVLGAECLILCALHNLWRSPINFSFGAFRALLFSDEKLCHICMHKYSGGMQQVLPMIVG